MNRDLSSLLAKARQRLPFTAAMELVEAVAGQKISRLAFSENNVPWLDDLLTEYGAQWEPAYAPFYHLPDEGKGTWSSRSEQTQPAKEARLRSWQIYIAQQSYQAIKARDTEAVGDERGLGLLLGIPPCCIDFYLSHRQQAQQMQNDYTLHSADHTDRLFELPHWNNTLTQYFGISLLSFAPCSYRCQAAMHYAQNRWAFANDITPSVAGEVLAQQACAGIYTEFEGIHLLQATAIGPNALRLDASTLNSTQPNGAWAKDLRATREIHWQPENRALILKGSDLVIRSDLRSTTRLFHFVRGQH